MSMSYFGVTHSFRRFLSDAPMTFSATIRWQLLARIGRSKFAKLTSFVPFFGILLLMSNSLLEWFQTNGVIATSRLPMLEHILSAESLYYFYFGLCHIGVGSIFFYARCPEIIQTYNSAEAAIDAIERQGTRVMYTDSYRGMLNAFFAPYRHIITLADEDFLPANICLPIYATSYFYRLMDEFGKRYYGIISDNFDGREEGEKKNCYFGPRNELNPAAIAYVLWRAQHFDKGMTFEIENNIGNYIRDIIAIRYKIDDVARFKSRFIVFALFVIGFTILTIPTIKTFFLVGLNFFK